MKTDKPSNKTKYVLLIITIVTLILLIRDYDSFFNPQLFAEDGSIFLGHQQKLGYKAIFTPYRGYYHLAPRLVAYISDFFSLYYTPAIYCYSALIFTLFTSVFIFLSQVDNKKNMFLFSVALVLVPHNCEVFMHNVNIQWILAAVLPFIYIQPPIRKWPQTLLSMFLVAFVGFTGPFLAFSWPLIFIRLAVRKKINIHEILLYFGVMLVAVIQSVNIIKGYSEESTIATVFNEIVDAIFLRFGAHMYFGQHLPGNMPRLTSIAAGVMIMATLFAIIFIKKGKRYNACIFLLFGTIIFGLTLKSIEFDPLAIHPFGRGARYYFIPYLCFFYVYFILADSKKFLKWLGRLGIILMLFSSLTYFTRGKEIDYKWRQHIKRLEHQSLIRVPIPPGWYIYVHSQEAYEKIRID